MNYSPIIHFFQTKKILFITLFLFLVSTVPIVIDNGLILRVCIFIMLYSILSLSNMVIFGYGGMLNVGHTAFYGIGAYVSALLSLHLNLPFSLCFLISGVVAAIFGLILAIPCLRVSVDFLSLITLAFLEVFLAIANNWISVTRGPMGLTNIPAASIFGFEFSTQQSFYYLIYFILIIIYVLLRRLVNSPFGRALQATRDDEIAASSMGVNINRHKIYAFVIGSGIAGFAGCLLAHYVGFVGPTSFGIDTSFVIMQMCILGGLGSLPGAVFGAVFFTVMPEVFRPLAVYRMGLGGLIMLLVILIRPQGVFGSQAFAGKGGIFGNIGRKLKKRT